MALSALAISLAPAQSKPPQRTPAKFRYQNVGGWIEIDRLDTQGNLLRFDQMGVAAVSVSKAGGHPDSPFATVTIAHASGQIRIDCDSIATAITFMKFLTTVE